LTSVAAEHVHGHAESDRVHLDEGRRHEVGMQVGLREHDHRFGAALPRGREVTLEAAGIDVESERADEEHRVDVRRHDLLLGPIRGPSRGLARELRAPREDGVDRAAALVGARGDRDPVADCGQLARLGLPGEAPGDVAPELPELGEDDPGAAVLNPDAARDQLR
jgi:hypothetical protein